MPYFESRVRCNFNDFQQIEQIIHLYEELGVKNLILEPINKKFYTISKDLKEDIKNISHINIFYRFNLKPETLNEFKKEIKKYQNNSNLLSVETPTIKDDLSRSPL